MAIGELGKVYESGEVIARQGETGDRMYVIQSGQVEVTATAAEGEVRLSVLEVGDVFGEMALFTRTPRSATVRALGEVRGNEDLLQVDLEVHGAIVDRASGAVNPPVPGSSALNSRGPPPTSAPASTRTSRSGT